MFRPGRGRSYWRGRGSRSRGRRGGVNTGTMSQSNSEGRSPTSEGLYGAKPPMEYPQASQQERQNLPQAFRGRPHQESFEQFHQPSPHAPPGRPQPPQNPQVAPPKGLSQVSHYGEDFPRGGPPPQGSSQEVPQGSLLGKRAMYPEADSPEDENAKYMRMLEEEERSLGNGQDSSGVAKGSGGDGRMEARDESGEDRSNLDDDLQIHAGSDESLSQRSHRENARFANEREFGASDGSELAGRGREDSRREIHDPESGTREFQGSLRPTGSAGAEQGKALVSRAYIVLKMWMLLEETQKMCPE